MEEKRNLFYFIGNYSDFCFQTNWLKGLIVMNFYSQWFPESLHIGNDFVQLANNNSNCTFYSIDIEQSSEIANHFSITKLPTIKFFYRHSKGIDEIETITGWNPQIQQTIQNKIQNLNINMNV